MSLLVVDRLQRSFGGVRAVDGVSFTLDADHFAALIGPNGAGKSTLFNLIDGQIAPESGSVRYEGQPLAGLSTAQRTWRGIGRTFQVAQTFATMTVLQNAQLALTVAHGNAERTVTALWNLHVDAARSLLLKVGLESRSDSAASELAYGDLKRLELALALATRPRLLLMDEPTAGMAPAERTALMQLVAQLARELSIAVLFTEHSMDVVFGFARRVLVMSQGRLIADGAPDVVRDDPEVQRVYLGAEV